VGKVKILLFKKEMEPQKERSSGFSLPGFIHLVSSLCQAHCDLFNEGQRENTLNALT
jgi:hypothetical protein